MWAVATSHISSPTLPCEIEIPRWPPLALRQRSSAPSHPSSTPHRSHGPGRVIRISYFALVRLGAPWEKCSTPQFSSCLGVSQWKWHEIQKNLKFYILQSFTPSCGKSFPQMDQPRSNHATVPSLPPTRRISWQMLSASPSASLSPMGSGVPQLEATGTVCQHTWATG